MTNDFRVLWTVIRAKFERLPKVHNILITLLVSLLIVESFFCSCNSLLCLLAITLKKKPHYFLNSNSEMKLHLVYWVELIFVNLNIGVFSWSLLIQIEQKTETFFWKLRFVFASTKVFLTPLNHQFFFCFLKNITEYKHLDSIF